MKMACVISCAIVDETSSCTSVLKSVVVLMAARLERWKGHEVLIEAAKRLPPGARIHVWIAGADRDSGSRHQRDLASAAVSVTGGAPVRLLGERDDVPTLMRLADIYCQPNLKGEPFGIAIAEAMLASLPCVVSAAGGAAELLDGSCSVITAPGDAAGVADALRRLSASMRASSSANANGLVR